MVTATQFAAPMIEATTDAIDWEEVPCPLCAHEHWTPFIEAADNDPRSSGLRFGIVRCDRCGLRFTNPRPTFESMARFYPAGYAPHRRARLARRPLRRWFPLVRLTGRPCPERRSLPWLGTGRLLDFGCGGGEYLCRMQEQGWKVTGLDSSPAVVRDLKENLGLRAFAGTLPHPQLRPGSFDVVTMWSSLEHVHQPLETLRAAYQLLMPGGRLYLAVPNIDSWPYQWLAHNWFALEVPRHLTHFNASSLRTMLEVAGFQIKTTRMIAHPEWLRQSARIASRAGEATFFHQLLKLKPVARFAAWMCFLAGQSDCIMAMAERPL